MQRGKLGCEAEFTFTTTGRLPNIILLLKYIQLPKCVSIFHGNINWIANNFNFKKNKF
jgi:hypothetical protein